MNWVVFTIAWRYLRAKKGGGGFVSFMSLFSFIGIALGVATLILVMGVMTGFHHKLLDKILSFNAHTTILSPTQKISGYDKIVSDLKEKKWVSSVLPVVEGQALVLAPSTSYGVVFRGYLKQDLLSKTLISDHVVEGSLQALYQNKESVLIGKKLAQILGAHVGARIKVLSPQGQKTPFGYAPKQKIFTVVGIFDTGQSDYNKNFILTSLESAQAYYSMGKTVSFIEVDGRDPEAVRELTRPLRAYLKPLRLFQVDWQQKNKSFFAALVVEKNMMFIVLSLVILIAAFNIVTGLVMMVRDKTRDIGILRAMGLTRRQLQMIFSMIGMLIGCLGTLLGVTLALIVGHYLEDIRQFLQGLSGTPIFDEEIYYLTKLPVHITLESVLRITGVSLLLSFLATLYPVWRVGKLTPVEAIHYE